MFRNIVLLVLLAVHTVLSDKCEPLPAMNELDISKTDGWWYLQYYEIHDEADKQEHDDARCLTMFFRHKPDGRVFVLDVHLPNESEKKNEGASYMGIGERNTTGGEIWFEQWNNGVLEYTPNHIVDTDYDNYMIISFCYLDKLYTWVATRAPEDKVADDTLKHITHSLEGAKRSMDHYTKLPRNNCPH